jgi:hypothetical protein
MLQLQRAIGNKAVTGLLVARHPVAATPVHRHTALDLFGDGTPANPGTTLAEFHRSARLQADWFVEPSLTGADRDDLWSLLRRVNNGPHILAGVGDLRLPELRSRTGPEWAALTAFSRGCHAGSSTVRISSAAAYTLAQRIALGSTLLDLEGLIPPEVLRLTVSEVQLSDLQARALMPALTAYWRAFSPHLQRRYEASGAMARGPEFQNVLDLLTGPGMAPFMPLLGRVRNLHRFSPAMLTRLVHNFADMTRRRAVHLVLHTGHDEAAFQESARLFEDLVLNSPNLVLVLEGQGSLAAITAEIPNIAATYGQPDGTGTPRIGQVMIAGHGQARTVELAGTGAPTVVGGHVSYPSESLDLDTNRAATEALMDTLMRNLDPATARVVFAGCLVGSNPVPAGTPAAAITAHIASTPSLTTWTETRGAGMGLSPGFAQGARASVGLGAASSLMEPGTGNLGIQYDYDPNAFGTAAAYVASGHEPEGLFRAAVEVAATAGPIVAETHLRTRLAAGISPRHPWWDEITIAFVNVALDGVAPGTGVGAERLNALAHMSGIPFLARWPGGYGITAAHFVGHVNNEATFRVPVYDRITRTPTFTAPGDDDARAMRLLVEQGWMQFDGGRAANLMTYVNATPRLTAELIERYLDTGVIGASSPTLFPAAAPVTSGRVRLALAWLRHDPANADARAFLDGQVVATPDGPELSPAVRAELGGFTEHEVLETLGRLTPTTMIAGPMGVATEVPEANVEVLGTGGNRVFVEPHPYLATVLPHALNVRTLPSMRGEPFAWLHRGDAVQVVGFTHNWAAVDRNGRLGFVYRTKVSSP